MTDAELPVSDSNKLHRHLATPNDCGPVCVFHNVRSSAIYCAFPIFFPGNANLLIGVLNWSSEEPSWGAAFPGTLTVYSTFYTVLCGKASAKII